MHATTDAESDEEDEADDDDEGNGNKGRVQSNISTALRSALNLMRTRIVSGSPRDVVGVMFYDTVSSRLACVHSARLMLVDLVHSNNHKE